MQAAEAGAKLKGIVGDESVYFMVSPYTRTRMTYDIVKETMNPKKWAAKEDPRLRGESVRIQDPNTRGKVVRNEPHDEHIGC